METKKNIQVSDVTFEVSYTENEVQCFASVSKVHEHFANVSEALLLVLREAMQLEPMAVSYKYGVNVVLTDEYDGYSYSVEAIHKSIVSSLTERKSASALPTARGFPARRIGRKTKAKKLHIRFGRTKNSSYLCDVEGQ